MQRFKVVSNQQETQGVISADQVLSSCPELVIKAQILAGGRGKGHFLKSGMKGGVKLTKDRLEAVKLVANMINDQLVTAQTTQEGVTVNKVMVAEALDIETELYLAILMDRGSGGPVIVASPRGGMDIEQVAHDSPDQVKTFPVDNIDSNDLDLGLARRIAREGLGLQDNDLIEKSSQEIVRLYSMFMKLDATQIEINPLGITPCRRVVCFDAKIQFDENALFRQRWLEAMAKENESETDSRELLAAKDNLNFVPMTGNIGCLVNGAGLAMATMDIIHLHGGDPANFLDVGGGVTQSGVESAFKIITSDASVKTILVNIFGGIVNCELVARGLVAAKSLVSVPIVVRLEGTNVEAARRVLATIPDIVTASDLDDAAQKAVKLAKAN